MASVLCTWVKCSESSGEPWFQRVYPNPRIQKDPILIRINNRRIHLSHFFLCTSHLDSRLAIDMRAPRFALSTYLSVYLSTYLFVYIKLFLVASHLDPCLATNVRAPRVALYLSIYLSIYLFFFCALSIYLSVYLSTYLSQSFFWLAPGFPPCN